jgi:nitrate/nitrite-specific signal transduction histidine kinase
MPVRATRGLHSRPETAIGWNWVIADDGQGFEPESVASDKSFGLASMRERAQSLEGELQVETQPGHGTRVILSIPLKGRAGGITYGSLAPAAR